MSAYKTENVGIGALAPGAIVRMHYSEDVDGFVLSTSSSEMYAIQDATPTVLDDGAERVVIVKVLHVVKRGVSVE